MQKIKITCDGSDWLPFNSLSPLQGDLKERTPEQLSKLKELIIKFGFSFPFFIWKDNETCFLMDGHGRDVLIKEMIKDGFEFVSEKGKNVFPVVYIYAENRVEAKEKLLAANSQFGKISYSGLLNFVNEPNFKINWENISKHIEIPQIDFKKFNFQYKSAEKITNPDEVPELQKEIQSKQGDLFVLNDKHRLLCGDCTDKYNINQLLEGNKIDMVLTDPPYGMNLDTDFSKMAKHNQKKNPSKMALNCHGKKYDRVINDDKPFDPTFIFENFSYCKEIFLFGADYYADKLPNLALSKSSWFVWDKKFKLEEVNYSLSEFELIWSYKKHARKILRYTWFGACGLQTDLDNYHGASPRQHPNQKPTALYTYLVENYSKEDNILWDGYCGSGTLFLVAEDLKRVCYGQEIDPQYVDVTLRRYHKLYPEQNIKCINRKFDFAKLFNNL